MIASFAPAKVNLYLHVTARRADGYHLLDSLAVFPNIGDRVTVAPAATLSLAIDGPFAHSLQADPDNLVLRAARALHPAGGAAIRLTKNLPVASGIGGGSADAAAALRALAWLWGLAEPDPEVALRLGADVPVCLRRQSARMGGIGEKLRPAPQLPGFGILLVNPGVAVATAAIFKSRNAAFSPPAALPEFWPSAAAMAADLATLTNDLAAPAIRLAPVIGDVLAALNSLPGCLLARMSGSGATCFGLFGSPAAATHAATLLPQPNWWRWGGGLYEPAAPDL